MVPTRQGTSVDRQPTVPVLSTADSSVSQRRDSSDHSDRQVMSPRLDGLDEGERDGISQTVDRELRRSLDEHREDDTVAQGYARCVLSHDVRVRDSSRSRSRSSPRLTSPAPTPSPRIESQRHGGDNVSGGELFMKMSMPDFSKITKLEGQEDFEDWEIEGITLFRMWGLDVIVTGEELLADQETLQGQRWWKARRSKAMGVLVLSMERDAQRNYRELIRANDCTGLWHALRSDFAQRRPTNPVTILGELFTRRLQSDETAAAYIKDPERMQLELRRTHATLGDEWLTRIMLTNAIDVFEDVSREHTQAQARGAKLQSLSDAKNLLLEQFLVGSEQLRRIQQFPV